MNETWISSRQAPDTGSRVEFMCTGSADSRHGTFDGEHFVEQGTNATVNPQLVDKWRLLDSDSDQANPARTP